MRISFIVGAFPSLSETFILNQMTGLLDDGHRVTIYAGARSADVITHEDVISSGLLKHVRFHNDKPKNAAGRLAMFFIRLPGALVRAPRPVLNSLNVFKYGREATSLNLFFKVLVFLETRDDDIVFCHFGQNGRVGVLMKELGALKGKVVTVFHASDITAYVWKQGRAIYKDLFEKGDLFLPISRHAKNKLLELGCPERRIHVHRMGVDLSQFKITTRRRFGSSALKILSVARLVEKKGIRYGIEAAAILMREGIPFEYVIIGDGTLRGELEDRARYLNIADKVKFIGWQDSGAVRRALKDADIFLAPSVQADNGDEEGIPVVLMEAMASRVPVVTTTAGAIRELVTDKVTGFIVEQKSPQMLADTLKYLWNHPEKAQAAAAQARSLIEEQYSVQTLNKVLLKLFSAVAYDKQAK